MRDIAILFDLDGTLVDTAPDLHGALSHSLNRGGREPVSLDDVRHRVGRGARALLEQGMKATGGMPEPEVFEALVADFFTYYGDHLSDNSKPYEGVRSALEAFRAAGANLAVCTNKPHGFAVQLLKDLDMAPFFTAVTGGDSFPTRKPDAGHILGTLERMGHTSGKAFMIGDSDNDITAAHNAGLPCIAVSYGYTEIPVRDLGPDHIIDNFDELVPLLTRLVSGRA